MKMRTQSYVFTVHKDSPEVLEQLNRLKELRQSVSLLNKPRYVRRSFPFATLEEASRWDVYVYYSHTTKPKNGGYKYVS